MPLKYGTTLCEVDVEFLFRMLFAFTLAAVSFLTAATPVLPESAQELFAKYGQPKAPPPFSIIKEFDLPVEPPPVVAIKEVQKPKRLICKGCNHNENRTLAFLQDKGITDKNALATIMGNIRQESTFHPNICEGGARTSYGGCHSGGYGLIQWTSSNRYYGLGSHARQLGASPSVLETQLSYMLTEPQWKRIEDLMKTPGKSIDRYMNYAHSWIGWGHHGARTSYAYDYARKFTWDV